MTGGSSHFQVSKRQKCIIDNSIKKSAIVLREFTAKKNYLKVAKKNMDFVIQIWKESAWLSRHALNENFVKYAM